MHSAVLDFNRKALPEDWSARNRHGAWVGEKFDPIRRVGLYVPGGQVPLVSTVLMTATLARIAGCPEIAAFTPSGPDGKVAPDLLAALDLVGVAEVYRMGGVHAIGAMAYGTRAIPAVDKIFGPGNAYVCEAKRQVFGTVGVDLLPGPSEVMVIADGSARADYAAADLLAQAEHGSGREKIYLVAKSSGFVAAVGAEITRQLAALGRSEKTRKVLDHGFLAIVVSDLEEAADVANRVAPEHLELMVSDAAIPKLVARVTTAGAIMIGGNYPDGTWGLRGGTKPCPADGRSRPILKRASRGGLPQAHKRPALRAEERAQGGANRGRTFGDGEARRAWPLGHDTRLGGRLAMTRAPAGRLALAHVSKLHAYTPGLQPSGPGWIKLNTNECPYPPSPRVAEAIERELGADGAALRLYPDPRSSALRSAVAKMHCVDASYVCIGNGSDDILNLLVRCFCGPGAAAAFTLPSYSLYPGAGWHPGRRGCADPPRPVHAPACRADRRLRSEGALPYLAKRADGSGFSQLGHCRDSRRHSGGSLSSTRRMLLLPVRMRRASSARHPNLVIVRTLSKAYALAGIRVGYALADPEVIGLLDRVRDSYNVSRLSQAAALAALGDRDYYAGVVGKVKATRDYYLDGWSRKRGWFTFPSEANFICTEPRDGRGLSGLAVAKAAYDFLFSRKVLVRHFPSDALTASFLRISVGTDDEMLVLDDTLDAWLKAPPNA